MIADDKCRFRRFSLLEMLAEGGRFMGEEETEARIDAMTEEEVVRLVNTVDQRWN